jgi:hypothetical protein
MRIAHLAAAAVLAVTLAGCAPITIVIGPTGGPSPSETTGSTPPPSGPDALVLGVQGLTLVDGEGGPDETVARDDVSGSIDLLTGLFGAPDEQTTEFGTFYDWGAVSGSDSGWFNVRFSAPDLDGVDLRTSQGIKVGDTRDAVTALDPFDDGEILGLEAVPEPGTDSLSHPGDGGTSYIAVFFDGDTVIGLGAPAGDWRDL